MRIAHEEGLGVVWDNDDNFAAIDRAMPDYVRHGGLKWERRSADMRRIFELAGIVTSPSEHLCEVHLEAGAREVAVVPNRIQRRDLTGPQISARVVVIGWLAGREHRMDVRALGMDEVLARVLERSTDVYVESVGISLGLKSDRYIHTEGVHFPRLISKLASLDIGIAPLADLPFNRSRSDIKVREYAAGGVPWLASPIGPYTGLGPDQGGMLVGDADWEDALVRFATDAKRRRKLSRAAQKWAARETIERSVGEWEQILTRAIEVRQSE
ncbi:glycosyltransferase [Conexibacter sp. CPCC 206217]|uniref:glycosyltransferase n=1 Tax=Conexibacter sp. CPCC 206217 TaxID=3064574 RepID=UPI00271D12FD|nr:glycosyltransferase [Conexibacter sp. CPCC 206217]MDO8213037.1 hypothetical protein [Conexibacter sp. CPCC 206217]